MRNIKLQPNKKIPDDNAPSIKYFKPASELLIQRLFLEIRINKGKVWSSKPKYVINRLLLNKITIEPNNIVQFKNLSCQHLLLLMKINIIINKQIPYNFQDSNSTKTEYTLSL